MTEQEWLTSNDPTRMLRFFTSLTTGTNPARPFDHKEIDSRKLRLFACACARQVWHLLTDPRSRHAVEVAERYADGLATARQMEGAGYAVLDESEDSLPLRQLVAVCCHAEGHLDAVRLPSRAKEAGVSLATQAALLRDIAGNVFHSIKPLWATFAVSGERGKRPIKDWLTPTVLSLTKAAYEERIDEASDQVSNVLHVAEETDTRGTGELAVPAMRRSPPVISGNLDPVRLAVLRDALLDAGCGSEEILDHLTEPLHVRGCWAIDTLLNRS